MKKMMMMAVMMVMTISANAMSYTKAKNEALFLSDKMAYELNLNDAQFDAVYEINLDYLMSVDSPADVYGPWWNRRNADLRLVLTAWQFDKYIELSYFYRPMTWHNGTWTFAVYHHYDRARFLKPHPKAYKSYKGGNNRKPAHHYADKRMNNSPHSSPAARDHKDRNGAHNPSGNHKDRNGADRPSDNHKDRNVAHNPSGNNRRSGHFAGRK